MKAIPFTQGMTGKERDWMLSIGLGLVMAGVLGALATIPQGGPGTWSVWVLAPFLVIPLLFLAVIATLPFGWGEFLIEGVPGNADETFFIAMCLVGWWIQFALLSYVAMRIRRTLGTRP